MGNKLSQKQFNVPHSTDTGSMLYNHYIEQLRLHRERVLYGLASHQQQHDLAARFPSLLDTPSDSITILHYSSQVDLTLQATALGMSGESIAPFLGTFVVTPLDLNDPQWEVFHSLPNRDLFRYLDIDALQHSLVKIFARLWNIAPYKPDVVERYPLPPHELTARGIFIQDDAKSQKSPKSPKSSERQTNTIKGTPHQRPINSASNKSINRPLKAYDSQDNGLFSPHPGPQQIRNDSDSDDDQDHPWVVFPSILPQVHMIPTSNIPINVEELFAPSIDGEGKRGLYLPGEIVMKGRMTNSKPFPAPYTIQPNFFSSPEAAFNNNNHYLPYISIGIRDGADESNVQRTMRGTYSTPFAALDDLLYPLRSSNISLPLHPSPKGIIKVSAVELEEFEMKGLWKRTSEHLPPTRIACIIVSLDTSLEAKEAWNAIDRCIASVTKSIAEGQSHLGLEKLNVHVFNFLQSADLDVADGFSKDQISTRFINAGFPPEQVFVHYLSPHVMPFSRNRSPWNQGKQNSLDNNNNSDEGSQSPTLSLTKTSKLIADAIWPEIFNTFFKIQLEKMQLKRLILEYPCYHNFWMNYNRWPQEAHVMAIRKTYQKTILNRGMSHFVSANALVAFGSGYSTRLMSFSQYYRGLMKKSTGASALIPDEIQLLSNAKRIVDRLKMINVDNLPQEQEMETILGMRRVYMECLKGYQQAISPSLSTPTASDDSFGDDRESGDKDIGNKEDADKTGDIKDVKDVKSFKNVKDVKDVKNNQNNQDGHQSLISPLLTHPLSLASPSNPLAPFILIGEDGINGHDVPFNGMFTPQATTFLFSQFSKVEKEFLSSKVEKEFLSSQLLLAQKKDGLSNIDPIKNNINKNNPDGYNSNFHWTHYPTVPSQETMEQLANEQVNQLQTTQRQQTNQQQEINHEILEHNQQNTHNQLDLTHQHPEVEETIKNHFDFKGFICNRYPYLFHVSSSQSESTPPYSPILSKDERYGREGHWKPMVLHPTSMLISSRQIFDFTNRSTTYSFDPKIQWPGINVISNDVKLYDDRQIVGDYFREDDEGKKMGDSGRENGRVAKNQGQNEVVVVKKFKKTVPYQCQIKTYSTPPRFSTQVYSIFPSPLDCGKKVVLYPTGSGVMGRPLVTASTTTLKMTETTATTTTTTRTTTTPISNIITAATELTSMQPSSPLLKFFSPLQQHLITNNTVSAVCSNVNWIMRHDHLLMPVYLKEVRDNVALAQTPPLRYVAGIHLFEYNHEVSTEIDYCTEGWDDDGQELEEGEGGSEMEIEAERIEQGEKSEENGKGEASEKSEKSQKSEKNGGDETIDLYTFDTANPNNPLHHLQHLLKIPYLSPLSLHLKSEKPPDNLIKITTQGNNGGVFSNNRGERKEKKKKMIEEWTRLKEVAHKFHRRYHETTLFEPYQITSIAQEIYSSTVSDTTDNVAIDGYNNSECLDEVKKSFCNGGLLCPFDVIFIIPPSPTKMTQSSQPHEDDIQKQALFTDYDELSRVLMMDYPDGSVEGRTIEMFREKLNLSCKRQLDLLWKQYHFGIPSSRIQRQWNFHLIAHEQLEETLVQIQSNAVLERLKLFAEALGGT